MGVYISSDGTEKETSTMNSFNLVNALLKSRVAVELDPSDTKSADNVNALKEELLTRLDTRPKE